MHPTSTYWTRTTDAYDLALLAANLDPDTAWLRLTVFDANDGGSVALLAAYESMFRAWAVHCGEYLPVRAAPLRGNLYTIEMAMPATSDLAYTTYALRFYTVLRWWRDQGHHLPRITSASDLEPKT